MKTNTNGYTWLATALAVAMLAANVNAAITTNTLTPTGVIDGPSADYYGSINLINSSGLSGTIGVGDDALKTHDNDASGATMWVTTGGQINLEKVTFDLGANYDLAGTYIWNYNQQYEPVRGVKTFTIDVSTDGTTFTPLGTTFTLAAAGTLGPEPAQFLAFSASNVQKVRFDILTNYGDALVGLSEVRFADVIPEPATVGLALCGGLMLCLKRKRV